jgi:hypothetical protein
VQKRLRTLCLVFYNKNRLCFDPIRRCAVFAVKMSASGGVGDVDCERPKENFSDLLGPGKAGNFVDFGL